MTREVVSNDILDAAKAGTLHWNLMPAQLVTMAIQRNEARLSAEGALVAETGKFTGRSPEDKYVVDHPEISDVIDWNKGTKRLPPAIFADLRQRALAHMAGRTLFVQELWAGADPASRLKVRVVTEQAWHSLFARNMFLRPSPAERAGFSPDWTVLQLPSMVADPASHGTNSSTVIALDLKSKLVLVIGTAYAGEIKKSIFTVLNHILPEQGVFPMHCSANMGADGDTAVFFGLSGTGKTTLSADPLRTLIGDDEHGWSADGIFNFEGGCYAKVINLDPKGEPEIYSASTRFGTILENVILDPVTAATDFFDGTLTENTRSSYPLDFIPNASATGRGRHPSNVVMLTCDAFGVLPPISRLRPDQAMYHFLSGYTAKLAGTERGVTTPQAVFSACFGAPFMPRHPTVYAELLGQKLREHNAPCWLLNTGWSGGGAADGGKRMPLKVTRALLQAALDGSLNKGSFRADPVFGLEVPEACPGVDSKLLNPRDAWADPAAYDAAARQVAELFEKNFAKFEGRVDSNIEAGAIHVAA